MQKQIVKKLSPEQKLKLALDLYFNARELKASAIRKDHPELSEKEVQDKVKEIFLYAKS
jgi:hypothetical protein